MKPDQLLKKIQAKAKREERYRRDPRFLNTMGFLVAKGLLQTNYAVPNLPNRHLHIEDAIWAGVNVEPRILEVLPTAVLRLGRHFDLDPVKHPELYRVVLQLRQRLDDGDSFFDIPFKKLKVWADLPLKDGRLKSLQEKRVTKSFRLKPEVLDRLTTLAKQGHCTITDALERSILGR